MCKNEHYWSEGHDRTHGSSLSKKPFSFVQLCISPQAEHWNELVAKSSDSNNSFSIVIPVGTISPVFGQQIITRFAFIGGEFF